MMRGLEGKRVLVTGGASGIGYATAARFLEEDARVCILDRDSEAGAKAAKTLSGLSGSLPADVSQLEQVRAAFTQAIELMGGVDVVINNAGISIRHSFLDITAEEWQRLRGQIEGIYQKGSLPPGDFVDQVVEVIKQKSTQKGES